MKARPYASTSARRLRMTRLLVLYVSLGTAAGTAILASRYLDTSEPRVAVKQEAPKPKIQTVNVLVAAVNVNPGKRLTKKSLVWKEWPAELVGPSFVTEDKAPDALAAFTGQLVRSPIDAGEPITDRKLHSKKPGGIMSASLGQGMRAYSVSISPETSAGGFILPQDRVDVMLTWKEQKREQNESVLTFSSKMILTNVRVLAIDQNSKRKDAEKPSNVAVGKTATLELSIPQTEILAQSQLRGEISLILRGMAETDNGPIAAAPAITSMTVHSPGKGAMNVVRHTISVAAAAFLPSAPKQAPATHDRSGSEQRRLTAYEQLK